MGRRSADEMMAAVADCFHARNTWAQGELVRHLGESTIVVRNAIKRLITIGKFPLEYELDDGKAYWSLAKHWVPGGFVLANAEYSPLIQTVQHSARSPKRTRLLARLIASAPPKTQIVDPEDIVTMEVGEKEEKMLDLAESSLVQRRPLAIRYTGGSARGKTGPREVRFVSVQRIDPATPATLACHCHKAKELRWFRVDRIDTGYVEKNVAYVRVAKPAVDEFIDHTFRRYRGNEAPIVCRFSFREPEAAWIEDTLPPKAKVTRTKDGIDVSIKTGGVIQLARYLVGFGAAVEIHTPELAEHVRVLAEGALASLRRK